MRQPSAHVLFMVIMKVVKEFASGKALIAQPHKNVPIAIIRNATGLSRSYCKLIKRAFGNAVWLLLRPMA
jgi:hypothetical protein